MLKTCILMQLRPIRNTLFFFFADSIPRGSKMEDTNSKIKAGRFYIKLIPGAKSKQLNHYVKPRILESLAKLSNILG